MIMLLIELYNVTRKFLSEQ